MRGLEAKYTAKASVLPHWLSGSKAFWYLRHVEEGRCEFILVDLVKKSRNLAFDHKQLAQHLQEQTHIEVDPEKLPFSWIEVNIDGNYVRFQFNGQAWQFGPDGVLKEIEHHDIEADKPMEAEIASSESSEPVSVRFSNRLRDPILLYWIDFDKKPVYYGVINPGAPVTQQTYAGHIWQFIDETSGKVLKFYTVPDNKPEDVCNINPQDKNQNTDSSTDKKTKKESKSDDNKNSTANADKNPEPSTNETTAEEKRSVSILAENVWVHEPDGAQHQLTWDGSTQTQYDDVYISPDNRFAIVWQSVPAQERILNRIESSPADQLQPKLHTRQYLKPGDRIKQETPCLFDLEKRSRVCVDDSLFRNHYELRHIGWNKSSDEYRFIFNQRGHQQLRVLSICIDGRVRVVVEETSKTFIDYSFKMYHDILPDTEEMIWMSERDGYNHLYLIDLTKGSIKNQITKGKWNVREVQHVDHTQRKLWLKAMGVASDQDPYYICPAHVNLDGTGFSAHVSGQGTHSWQYSPDREFYVDTCAQVDVPPQTILRDGDNGQEIMFLEGGTAEELLNEHWVAPERFAAPGRDGDTLIYGIIIKPDNFDETKSYPVVEDIYAGPHDFYTPKTFGPLIRSRKLANEGNFIVVRVDGMGTNWRSKAFHDVCWKNLKDAGFPDRIPWLKAAASSRPWMDLSRMGIMGGSAGGQNTVAALIHHHDFYKVGVADCGCHDNRMDKLWWNELWMGWPVDESYAASSNVVHADKLEGKLMLTLGEMDSNVDPSSTLQLVNALNKAEKDYDFLFMPGMEHGCGESKYANRRRTEFLQRHLGGPQDR